MTESSKASSPQTAAQGTVARLENMGLGDGLLATALRRQMQEEKEGMVRPTALVTYNSPSQKTSSDIF